MTSLAPGVMSSTHVAQTTPGVLDDAEVLDDLAMRRARLTQALAQGDSRWSPPRSLARPILLGAVLALLAVLVYGAVVFTQHRLATNRPPAVATTLAHATS